MNLSERQKKMLAFIAKFVGEYRFPPTIREIGTACAISSTSVVKYNLTKLEKEELILRRKEVSRGLSLNWPRLQELGLAHDLTDAPHPNGNRDRPRPGFFQLPVLGHIAAGEPIQVEPANHFTSDEWIELNEALFRNPAELYALRVQGDSMIDALIDDGDIVILEPAKSCDDGEIVAVWLREENETTLKKFYHEGDRVRLQPRNPAMAPIYTSPGNVEVQGRFLSAISLA